MAAFCSNVGSGEESERKVRAVQGPKETGGKREGPGSSPNQTEEHNHDNSGENCHPIPHGHCRANEMWLLGLRKKA